MLIGYFFIWIGGNAYLLLCKGDSKVGGIEGYRMSWGVYHDETGRRMRNSSILREVRLGFPLDEGE